MKEKIAITLEDSLLKTLDALVENRVGKNRSQIIESFLLEHISERNKIHAIILAHDTKWDDPDYPFDIPKYLLPIAGKPVLFHQLKVLSQGGVRRVTIIVGKDQTDIFGTTLLGDFPHLEIDFVEVASTDKTGTALRKGMEKVIDTEYMLVINGDNYTPDLDIRDLLKYHKMDNGDWTFTLKYIRTNAEKFGNVTIHGYHVEEFIEKPTSPDLYKYLTNCGWYLITKEFYDSLIYQGEHLEIDLFPTLPKIGNILAYTYSKPWYHIQSVAEYERASGY